MIVGRCVTFFTVYKDKTSLRFCDWNLRLVVLWLFRSEESDMILTITKSTEKLEHLGSLYLSQNSPRNGKLIAVPRAVCYHLKTTFYEILKGSD